MDYTRFCIVTHIEALIKHKLLKETGRQLLIKRLRNAIKDNLFLAVVILVAHLRALLHRLNNSALKYAFSCKTLFL